MKGKTYKRFMDVSTTILVTGSGLVLTVVIVRVVQGCL